MSDCGGNAGSEDVHIGGSSGILVAEHERVLQTSLPLGLDKRAAPTAFTVASTFLNRGAKADATVKTEGARVDFVQKNN